MTGVTLAVGLFIGFCFGFIVCNIRDIEMFRECDRMMERAERIIQEEENE